MLHLPREAFMAVKQRWHSTHDWLENRYIVWISYDSISFSFL